MSFLDHVGLTSRIDINASLLDLQEKLRLRWELDHDIENILYLEMVRRYHLNESDKDRHRIRNYEEQLRESEIKYRGYIEEKIKEGKYLQNIMECKPNHIGEQALLLQRLDELNRMQSREIEKVLEEDRRSRSRSHGDEKLEKQIRSIEYSDEELLQQYEDGTRAREIQKMMENYQQLSPVPIPPPKTASQNFGSPEPATKIKWNGGKSKQRKSSPYCSLSKNQHHSQQFQDGAKPDPQYLEHKGFAKDEKNKVSLFSINSKKMNKNIQLVKTHRLNRTQRGRNSYKNKSSHRRPKTNKQQSQSIGKARLSVLETYAMQKIQNRLKVSVMVFKDSKYRNLKHEYLHLEMTFENEVRVRKQVKDKLNNHPSILRKHALVVEPPVS